MSNAISKLVKKNQLPLKMQSASPQIKSNNFPLPTAALREVNLPALNSESNNNVIAVYKDMNQPAKDFALNQKKQLFIGFVVFVVLGLGIVMGQHFNKSRNIANTADMAKLLPIGAETTSAEHYHYDKSCYKGENGEQVCMTRTSQQR